MTNDEATAMLHEDQARRALPDIELGALNFGDQIIDEVCEPAIFLRYSSSPHWAFFAYQFAGIHKLPVARLKLVSKAKPA